MKKEIIPAFLIILAMITACYFIVADLQREPEKEQAAKTEEIDTQLTKEDTVIVIFRDTEEQILNFQSVASGERYALRYTGTTEVSDRYGEALSMAQVPLGEIVDIVFSVHDKSVRTIQISSETWTYTDISKFSFDEEKNIMYIADDKYMLSKELVIASQDKIVELMDINEQDVLTVKGYNRVVTSITIDKGHGYLRLLNDEYFVGGWIEIGQSIIKPVEEDMLLTVPEGDYNVRLSRKGNIGELEIRIKRDKETEADLSKIDIKEVEKGMVAFDIIPSYAELKIDGEEIDYSDVIEIEYGVHQIVVTAEGYETLSNLIKVGAPLANIEIELEKEKEEDSSSSSSSTSSSVSTTIPTTLDHTSIYSTTNTTTSSSTTSSSTTSSSTASSSTTSSSSSSSTTSSSSTSSSTNSTSSSSSSTIIDPTATAKVYIDGPVGVEVYFDGSYVGIAPTNFAKVAGQHAVTLRKEGYQTRSYSLMLDSEDESVTFSFSELLKDSSE